jgi:CSLREA domain-containing protein
MRGPLALCVCLLLASTSASADTFTVSKTNDTNDGMCDTDCSLREAVAAANARPGSDLVRLKHSFYRLTVEVSGPADSQIRITDALVIRGVPERSTIDANGTNRHFEVAGGTKVELVDLTLRGGIGEGRGGSIYSAGDLTLRRVWVIGNRVIADDDGVVDGGGIWNTGELRMILCRVEGNIALDGFTLTGGQGGGIFNAGTLYLYDTALRSNVTGEDDSVGFGAGLYNRGSARVDRSFFWDNDPGDGEGGAIANRFGGSVALINSTLSNNGHDGADGALANGSMIEAQAEIATGNNNWANVLNSTIANNNGGGVLNTGRLTLRQALVAGNFSQDGNDKYYDSGRNCHNELDGRVTQVSSLVAADGNCPASVSVENRSTFNVVLEHLRYLGGPTPVHKPRPGPYAIDGGGETCPSEDQRNKPRPVDGNGDGVAQCDIGAMEVP